MNIERALRLAAGIAVAFGLGLLFWKPFYGKIFLAFVSINLIQSSFTNWCPMITIFKKCGLK